ncbi:sulfite exporter TauE/SafE family protein [Raoultella sp. BIGb0138]|uniref:sulfite exporter TauE/SafE family protein n=1 Tax=Raoultella sp. BIGb0138 TaxID=2485115 RepID=UPI00104BAE06|nr:sulfite exporter TauE/SafE family protein [Raoultella sp. BIGb0138]
MMCWLFFCGVVCGVTTWLFGFGGGFVTVPLIYLLVTAIWGMHSDIGAQAMQIAVATSALVMLCAALLATWRHLRAGTLCWRPLRVMFIGIAAGGIAGAVLALSVKGEWIRGLFIAYLLATILDCYLRPGFMAPATPRPAPTAARELATGGGIGLIAAFLGVGGSVMTVPLIRRRGAAMAQAAAMANLLTLPLAASATLTWLVLAWLSPTRLPGGFIGDIWLSAAGLLVAGSWLGLRMAARWLGRLPDRWHARIYPLLLMTVLLVMSVQG